MSGQNVDSIDKYSLKTLLEETKSVSSLETLCLHSLYSLMVLLTKRVRGGCVCVGGGGGGGR